MKSKLFAAILCLGMFMLVSCGDDDDSNNKKPDPNPGTEGNVTPDKLPVKTCKFVVQGKKFEGYDKWVYVNLETGETETKDDVNFKQWRQYGPDGTEKDDFGKYNVIKETPAGEPNAPAKWHLAFHIYEPMTNGGEVFMSDLTDLNSIKGLPENVTWVADKKVWLIGDMTGMMTTPTTIGYIAGWANPEMYKWHYKKGMGEYFITMSKSDPSKAPVFFMKFKDGSYALIQYKSMLDETGKKKEITFDYKFVKAKK